jgi:pimeloyl-ACP methyl ester carboxylesterase
MSLLHLGGVEVVEAIQGANAMDLDFKINGVPADATSVAASSPASAAPVEVIEEHEATVLGYRMRYLAAGDGEPIVLLHGLADSADAWMRVIPSLARSHRVIAPDMLGCGLSDKPKINYSLWALATYLRHFFDALNIQAANVVGHSLGGGVALHFYIQYPERVKRLALVASGGMGRDLPLNLRLCTLAGSSRVIGALLESRHVSHPLGRIGHALLGRLWPSTTVADRALAASDVPSSPSPNDDAALTAHEEDVLLERLRDPEAREAFLSMLRGIGDIRGQNVSALEALPHIRVPVLLVNGKQDTVIPISHARAAWAKLRQGRMELLDGCGHCPHREAPDAVTRLLERFFGGSSSATPISAAG